MEIKKTPRADLENKKSIFCLLGLVVALGFLYIVFEWTEAGVKAYEVTQSTEDAAEEEEIMNTFQDNTPPPPPPPQEAPPPPPDPTPNENFEEVDNDKKVDDIGPMGDDAKTEIQDLTKKVEEEEIEDPQIYVRVEKKAAFPGGQAELNKYLSKAINYPEEASDNGIQGRVIVSFVVNTNGSIVDVEVLRGVHPALDKEAMRVVKAMPAWTPASNQGKKVRSKFTLPINFKLATR